MSRAFASSWSSFRQPVLPAEGQEDADAQLSLNVVGDAVLAVPSPLVLLLLLRRGDGEVLEVLVVDVVADLEVRGQPSRDEDAEADADAEVEERLVLEGAVVRVDDRDGAREE